MSEDLPEEINRVELDDKVKDSNGMPAPRVTYRASENTKAMLQHGANAARQVLEAAGARTVFDSGRVMNFAHYMGTARMGTDPKRSVVDGWHQCARGRESVRRRRQLVHHERGRQSDLHDRRAGAAGRRWNLEPPPGVGLIA